MDRRAWRFVGKCVLLLLGGAVAGVLLLTLAYCLPVNLENREASYGILEQEGGYPRASVNAYSFNEYFHSYLPDVLDDGTDKVMLYTALDAEEGNPLVRAMKAYSEAYGDYAYYWHGYICILRPLFLLLDYSGIRMLNSMGQLALLCLLAYVIGMKKGMKYVLMLASSYFMLGSLAMPLSLQFTWVFYIAYGGILALLLKEDFFAVKSRYLYFFLVMGMLTSYFDLLTYPLFTWGAPLIWHFVMDKSSWGSGRFFKRREMDYVLRTVYTGISWIVGYGGMWMAKWVFAAIILGRNIFMEALDEVFFRSGVQEAYGLEQRLNAVYLNWKHYEYGLFALVLGAWLLWWLWRGIKGGWRKSVRRYAYFLIGASSIVWYFVLANHTQGHHFFTYRIFGVSVLAFFAMVLEGVSEEENAVSMQRKRAAMCCAWGIAALLSLPLVLLAKEEMMVTNGASEFGKMEVASGGVIESSFSPAFSRVIEIGFGLETEGTKGQYDMTLWEGEEPRYRETFLIGEREGGNYQHMSVSWKLDSHKTYRFTIEVRDNDQPVYVWATLDGQMPLSEFGELSADGRKVGGQLLAGLIYRRLPESKKTLLFLAMTWTGIIMLVVYTFFPEKSENLGKKFAAQNTF